MKCKNCQSEETIFTPTPETQHYGRLNCAKCGLFAGWEKHPKNIARDHDTMFQIGVLRDKNSLTGWERSFLESIKLTAPKMSPRQREIFDRIWKEKGK